MAMDYSGLFKNPADIRAERVGNIVRQQQQLAGLGGSMSGLLGQIAGGGNIMGQMLAEGIAGATGMKTEEEKQAKTAQDIFKTIDPNDPETYFKASKALSDAGLTKAAVAMVEKGSQAKAQQQQLEFAAKQEARASALFPLQMQQAEASIASTQAGTEATISSTKRAEELQPWQIKNIESGIASRSVSDQVQLAQEGRASIEFDKLFPLRVAGAEQDIELKAEEGERARTMFPIKVFNASLQGQATQTQIEQARQNMTFRAQEFAQAAELHPYKVEASKLGIDKLNEDLRKIGIEIDMSEFDLSQQGKPTPEQYASNLQYFEQESLDAYYNADPATRTSDMLTYMPPDKRKAASTFGKQLIDQGMQPGSEQFIDHMRQFNEATIKGKTQQTITQMTDPLKQAEFVETSITSDDLYKMAQKSQDAINKSRSTIDLAKREGGEALTVLQRNLSTIYDSNVKAKSEIDRFIDANKSVARTFKDFASRLTAGQVSAETFINYEKVLQAAERGIRAQKKEVVDRKLGVYGSYLSDEVKSDINATYGTVDPLRILELE